MSRKRQIATLKRDVANLVDSFSQKQKDNEFLRSETLIDLWRCVTKVRLLARLENSPPASSIISIAEKLDVAPIRVLDLANIGEWIQVDRDTRNWSDKDEYDEYWLCHYDGDQTVMSFTGIRADIKEIEELNKLWMS